MLSLMPLFALIATAVYAFGSYRLVLATLDAPIGYENDEGFHYGLEVVRADAES